MPRRLLQAIRSKLPWLDQFKPILVDMGRPVLFTSLTLTALLVGLRYLGAFQSMELFAYDQLVRNQPTENEDDRLLIVGITEEDIQRRQEWPISDRTLAELLKTLEEQQPRAIGLDIIRDIPIGEGREQLLSVLQQSDRIVTVCKVSASGEPGVPPPPDTPPNRVGFADLVVDPGGTLRRALLLVAPPPTPARPGQTEHFCSNPDNTLVSLSLQLSLQYFATQNINAELTSSGVLQLGSTPLYPFQPSTGGYQNGDSAGYQIMLNYRSPDRVARQVSLMDVLEGRVDPALIRDRIVLIGYTTPEAKDDFYTPYSGGQSDDQKMPGVVVHAQIVSQILGAVLDGRSTFWTWADPLEIGWIWAWSLVGGVLAWYARHPLKFGGVIVVAIASLYGVCFWVFLYNGWIPLVPPAIAVVMTAAGVVLIDRFNKSSYGQNVYRQVKTFLKLNIEIDQEKLEKQVSEITETDYFSELQQRAKNLRNQRDDFLGVNSGDTQGTVTPSETGAGTSTDDSLIGNTSSSTESLQNSNPPQNPNLEVKNTLKAEDGIDYLKNLQQKAKNLRAQRDTLLNDDKLSSSSEEIKTSNTSANSESEDDYEVEYLRQLQQETKRLRDQGDATQFPQDGNRHDSTPH